MQSWFVRGQPCSQAAFLFQEPELRLVKFLPEILALQRDLVRRFQNTTDVRHCSIRDFLEEPLSGKKPLPKLISETKSTG